MKTKQRIATLLCVTLVAGALGGCGGNGGDGNTDNASQGLFVDAPVSGLEYTSGTFSGITGPNGEFSFLPGEQVEFFIGDIALGMATGDTVVTPLDLFSDATDVNDPRVINLLRLLQTLDVDGIPDNGIVITPETREQAVDISIDFSVPIADFAGNPELLNLLGAVTNVSELVDAPAAIAHFQQTMAALREDLIAQVVAAGQIRVVVETPSEADLQTLLDQFAQAGMPLVTVEVDGTTLVTTVDLQQLNQLFSSPLVREVDDFRPVDPNPPGTDPQSSTG